jgi:hypothetical protein
MDMKGVDVLGRDAFEYLLGMQGAPFLMGERPALLLSFRKASFDDLKSLLLSYAPCFHCKGIELFLLGESEASLCILFYRKVKLARRLKQAEVRLLLEDRGYDSSLPLKKLLEELSRRMREQGEFPHELGVFLGFPPADVRGFIRHHGRGFLSCGYWKVYHDPENAQNVFASFAACTRTFCHALVEGKRFEDLIKAG